MNTQQRRFACVAFLAAISCSDASGSQLSFGSSGQALVRASTCDEVSERLREYAIARMNEQVDRAVEAAYAQVTAGCNSNSGSSFGSPGSARGATIASSAPMSASAPSTPVAPGGAAAPAPSNTPAAPSGGAPAPSSNPAATSGSTPAPSSGPAAPSGSTPAPGSAAASTPMMAAATAPTMPSTPAGPNAEKTAMANATSTTNNQVEAVDEADIVKNDSQYVYAALNGALRILTAWPPEQAAELSRVALPGTPKKLLVHEDRALVYVSLPVDGASNNRFQATGAMQAFRSARSECTYGYDCDFGGDGTSTALLLFDISNRAEPRELRRIDLRGSLIAARRIGSVAHTVVVSPELNFPIVSTSLPINSCDLYLTKKQIDLQAEALRDRNTQIIRRTTLPELAPYVREAGKDYAADSCGSIYFEAEASGNAFTSVVSLDLQADAAPGLATIVSKAGAVYASEQALYMAVPKPDVAYKQAPKTSVVHKFRVGAAAGDVAYLASGSVKGSVLNQFSMDEYAGHLRVATTSGKLPSPYVHSTMSVLSQVGFDLMVAGEVDNIAKGEDIRSVRFDGEHGFVVTFKKTDPLYMFDLSDPEEPRITGELKIPGFSTYMHMLDDSHLLSIGYDADDQGSFAYFSGVLLQIFDVSVASAPRLLHKTVIGTRGSSSEALTNHLAFTFYKDMLALPMTICEGGAAGSFGTTTSFSGLILYDVNLSTGLTERGRVAHPSASGGYDNASCTNWWSRAGSVVQRSIFMDDYVYSIALDIMRVQNLKALGSDVASVSLSP